MEQIHNIVISSQPVCDLYSIQTIYIIVPVDTRVVFVVNCLLHHLVWDTYITSHSVCGDSHLDMCTHAPARGVDVSIFGV